VDISEETTVTGNPYFNEVTNLACPTGYDFHLEQYKTHRDLDLTCKMGDWFIDEKKITTFPECRGTGC